jgi:hypothetical protein
MARQGKVFSVLKPFRTRSCPRLRSSPEGIARGGGGMAFPGCRRKYRPIIAHRPASTTSELKCALGIFCLTMPQAILVCRSLVSGSGKTNDLFGKTNDLINPGICVRSADASGEAYASDLKRCSCLSVSIAAAARRRHAPC